METWCVILVVLYFIIGVIGVTQEISKISCSWLYYWSLYIVGGIFLSTIVRD